MDPSGDGSAGPPRKVPRCEPRPGPGSEPQPQGLPDALQRRNVLQQEILDADLTYAQDHARHAGEIGKLTSLVAAVDFADAAIQARRRPSFLGTEAALIIRKAISEDYAVEDYAVYHGELRALHAFLEHVVSVPYSVQQHALNVLRRLRSQVMWDLTQRHRADADAKALHTLTVSGIRPSLFKLDAEFEAMVQLQA